MRKIKFKVWDSIHKKMSSFSPYMDACLLQGASYDGITLLQATGLPDMCGKEIYERDLVQISNGQVGVVVYDEGEAAYDVHFQDLEPHGFALLSLVKAKHAFKAVVIGNQFENPEYLTGRE